MKNLVITLFIVIVIAILGMYFASFQVRETQVALKVRLGSATQESEIKKPGWYARFPAPIDKIYKFDSRMRVFESDDTETTTKGAVPIIVKTYVVWNIAEPLEFFNALGSVNEARNQLISQLSNTQNRIIGKHNFSEFVNSDPEKIQFKAIEEEMLQDLRNAVEGTYGIRIKTLGIKQLKVSQDVTKDVFERMKAERNRRTEATIAQGKAQATKIKTDAESKKTQILAAAQARAKTIRGQGDAEAAQYYKMLEADPELAMFLRDIDALKSILEKRSTVVLSADTQPFELLKKMPNLAPKPENKSS